MKKIKFFLYLSLIIFSLSSCSTVKEGFTNQKKNSSDEFLVEKKAQIDMPPNFEKVPTPDDNNEKLNIKKNNIKLLLSGNSSSSSLEKSNTNNSNKKNNNLEEIILGKIKSN